MKIAELKGKANFLCSMKEIFCNNKEEQKTFYKVTKC